MFSEDRDMFVLHGSPERDPDGRKLSAAIRAHYACERARAIRQLLVYVLAALGVLLWPLAEWPAADAARFRELTLAFFAVIFVALVVSWVKERARVHRRDRLASELHGERTPS